MLSDYQKALDELAWRFQSAEAALGIRAQNIAEGKGGGVFDDMASHRAHMSKRTDRHHTAVTRMRRVDACLAALPRRTVEDLAVAFTPAGRANHLLFRAFALQTPFHEVSLLGYALHVGAVLAAFQRAHGGSEPRSRDTMIAWLNDEATKGKNVVAGVVADTRIALESAVAAYEVQRLARLEVERESRERAQREREALFEREMQALNLKLWGREPSRAFRAMEASQDEAEARVDAALAGEWECLDYADNDVAKGVA